MSGREDCQGYDTLADWRGIQPALDHLTQGICVFDRHLVLVFCNRRFGELLCLPEELCRTGVTFEAIARFNAARGEYGPGAPVVLAERVVQRSRQNIPLNFTRERPNGKILEISSNPLPDGGFVRTYTDVTAAHRAEQALQQARELLEQTVSQRTAELESKTRLLEAIVENSTAPIFLKDLSGRYLLANQPFAALAGRISSDLVGHSDLELFPEETARRFRHDDYTVAALGEPRQLETDMPTVRGLRTFVVVKVPISGPDGRIWGICGIATDITERKHTERILAQALVEQEVIFENLMVGIALLKDRRFERVNRKIEKMLGYDRLELEGAPARLHYGSEEVYEALGRTAYPLLAEGKSYSTEVQMKRRDGSLFWATLVGKAVNPAKMEDGSIWLLEDITERKKVQEELIAAKLASEAASRAKSEFLANMSHELRTPLNAIIGFSDVIRQQMLGAVGREVYVEYAQDIFSSGTHLLGVINDILDMSKIEAGQLELYEETVALPDIAATCLTMLRPRMEQTGLRLVSELPPDLPKMRADCRAVTQILLNLLSNAVKFTPEGGSITLRARIGEEGDMLITVTDTGIGIEAAQIQKLFEPFQQASAVISRKHGGTGLGLPISRSLMALHGGELSITSTLGEGTAATVRFPANRVEG